jgi:hypothetical protein
MRTRRRERGSLWRTNRVGRFSRHFREFTAKDKVTTLGSKSDSHTAAEQNEREDVPILRKGRG